MIVLWPLRVWGDIAVSLSPRQCQPGDVVELRVQSSFESYTSFELVIPDREDWVLLTHEADPVRYTEGAYRQEARVLFQPLQAGEFDFSDVEAVVRSSEGTQVLDLAIPPLEVQPYVTGEDSDDPLALAEIGYQEWSATGSWWLWTIVVLVTLSVGLFG
ncbi:MAG: hypothetical protein EA353_00455, partial [Puniceicoccaceae bacterium]